MGVGALVGALLEHHLHTVVAEEPEVLLQHAAVREHLGIGAEAGGVVPEVESVGLGSPAVDVAAEGRVLGVHAAGDGVGEVALDGAEAGDDVAPQARLLRRAAGVLVGEGLDHDAGELALDRLGDGVDEADHRAGARLLLGVDRGAARALAAVEPVVLAHPVELRPRVGADAREDVGDDDREDVRVGEA